MQLLLPKHMGRLPALSDLFYVDILTYKHGETSALHFCASTCEDQL